MAENFGMEWVDEREKQIEEDREKGYFNIKEGDNRFVLLSNVAPLAQVFDPATKKYRAATEGDTGISIKGVCWVGQEGLVKQAKLPYKVVQAIRGLSQNKDWDFVLPFPHVLTLNAVNAGTKEVKYTLTPSPKTVEIPAAMLTELGKKPKPEDIVEKIKSGKKTEEDTREAPPADTPPEIDPNDIPF